MKKMILIVIAIMEVSISYLQGQDNKNQQIQALKPSWGLKAEANMSNFFISGTSILDSKVKIGGTFGGFLHLELTDHFVLQGELLYHYKTSKLNRDDLNGDFRYWGMEIPIYAIYQKKIGGGKRIYTGIGLYSEFGLSANLYRNGEKINLYEKDQSTDISTMRDNNIGFGFIGGYEFANGVQINLGYKIGVTNILDANSYSFSLLPSTISMGIGYHFR
ncbi:MAG: porin family protein [Dysgonomonas sp.]